MPTWSLTGSTEEILVGLRWEFGLCGGYPGSFSRVSADGRHSCWGGRGTVSMLGRQTAERADLQMVIQRVSAGSTHSCGIRTDGSVVCWGGAGWFGELIAPEGCSHGWPRRPSCGLLTDGNGGAGVSARMGRRMRRRVRSPTNRGGLSEGGVS